VPTLLVIDGFRFWFYSNEREEPPHVHVMKGGGVAKIWLQPVRVADAYGMTPAQLRRARELAFEHQTSFIEAWNDYFDR
jgi:hypothetical protein